MGSAGAGFFFMEPSVAQISMMPGQTLIPSWGMKNDGWNIKKMSRLTKKRRITVKARQSTVLTTK